jgi:glutamate N-acetyltransferase/amino-acid N-acetyltransferase
MSTNDTVLLLALGNTLAQVKGDDVPPFAQAVRGVCSDLARMIVDDGEGTTHTITIDVEGCVDRTEARKIAEAVANSPLVKTAIAGADPNWGRIVSAAGYAGIPFEETEMSLWLNGFPLYQSGMPVAFDEARVSASIRGGRETHVRLLFTRGDDGIRFWTTDLTAEYVRLNADYTT